ncbi:MAG: phage tail length tape measure family protein [Treponema sp.]|nr:phage tail length tape measure family protein [Treponema sp.]
MSENAGTVYAEIRLGLGNLGKDVDQASHMIRDIEKPTKTTSNAVTKNFQVMGIDVGGALKKMSSSGISQMASMATGMQKAFMAVPIVGAIQAIIGVIKKLFTATMDWIKESSQAYIKHRVELARLDAVFRTTGAAAWTSTRQLKDAAVDLATATGNSLNSIMEMQSRLLGYTQIVGENFDRASKAAVDMAAVMGMDVTSAAETLGRALDSPIEGLTALTRQGFRFKGELKDQIVEFTKMGRVAEAQALILAEVESVYKGAAEAMNEVSAQSRLEIATERLAVAQGETTSKMTEWWTKVRAEWKEARAEALELRNATRRNESPDYSTHIAQVEMLTNAYITTREELEHYYETIRAGEAVDRNAMARLVMLDEENELRKRGGELTHLLTQATEVQEEAEKALNRTRMMGWGFTEEKIQEIIEEHQRLSELPSHRAFESLEARQRRVMVEEYLQANEMLIISNQALADITALVDENTAKLAETMGEHARKTEDVDNLEALQASYREIGTVLANSLEETERALKAGLITEEQATQQRMAAHQTEANSINKLMTNVIAAREAMYDPEIQQLAQDFYDSLVLSLDEASAKYQEFAQGSGEKGILDQLREIEESTERAMTGLRGQYELGMISTEDYQERMFQLQKSAADQARSLLEQYGVDHEDEANEAIYKRVEAINDLYKAEVELKNIERDEKFYEKQLQDINNQLLRRTGTLEEIRQLEKDLAWKRITETEEFRSLMEKANDECEESQKKIEDLKAAFEELWKASDPKPWGQQIKDFLKDWKGLISNYGPQLASLYSQIAQNNYEATKRANDQKLRLLDEYHRREMALLEEAYLARKDILDRELQEKLYAMGFIDAATEEQHQRELELAIESGDQQRIFLAHSNLERFLIEEEYRQLKAEAEGLYNEKRIENDEKHAQEKKQIEYDTAMAHWQTQLNTARVSGASAIMQAMVNKWPIPAVAMIAMAKANQVANLKAIQGSKPQKYAQGGIVSGSSYRGDNVHAMVNSGEMIIDMQDQKNLWEMIKNGVSGSNEEKNITIIVPVSLDGRILTEVVAEHINNGYGVIKGRGIV